ncbi:sensor histidine kinase [Nocardioides taihuensis]|uniref:histidine kinase n=1 Tax=Nocardioides taihuensis TaxID=1835606 RepID=A0ABW0BND5_9ACTN
MDRPRPSRPPLPDVLLAAALAAVAWWEVLVTPLAEDVVSGPVWLDLLAVSAGTLPLAFRRQAPFAVAIGVYGVLAARALAGDPLELYPTFLAALVATYTVASYAPLRDAVLSAVFSALALAVLVVRGSGTDAAPAPLATAVLFGTVWLVGRVVGVRNERARELHAARDQHAAEAVAAERERIARELHDAVSHSLAAIVMQAGGARNVLADDPERAAASLAVIEQTARRGLDEMRRMLGLLGEEAALAPQPGLDRIDALVADLRAGGLDVRLSTSGTPGPVPIAVGLAAYRIVQEALTNVIKHASPCRAEVRLDWSDEAVEVTVTDDGPGTGSAGPGAGRGLAGMRERVAVLGGVFEAGRGGSGGFRVHARLPR